MQPISPNTTPSAKARGSVLLMVMIMVGVSLTLVAAVFAYASTNNKQNQRAADYYVASSAAEAATEKLVSQMTADYRNYGDGYLTLHMSDYATNIPNSTESGAWTNFDFLDLSGTVGRVEIQYTHVPGFGPIGGQYGPLKAYVDRYRILANARSKSSADGVVASVFQDIELDRIPIFQYAIFFNTELEFTPMPAMNVYGAVHCNTNIYCNPFGVLTFFNDVTCSGSIIMGPNPRGPLPLLGGATIWMARHDSGVSTLSLPIGTNNSPAAVRQVLELPATGENSGSSIGQQRYYNKADLLIMVSNTAVTVRCGPATGSSTVLGTNDYTSWLSTNTTFYNTREAKQVRVTQIDVSKLVSWNLTNVTLRPILAAAPAGIADVRTIYVYDGRTFPGSTNQPGIRLVNGDLLPPKGLTVATPFPMYVQGHYNCPVALRGTTNTTGCLPASVACDALTVLSSTWQDTNALNSSTTLSRRIAGNTTFNCAFLTGIVLTSSASDSGGVENFPRFLEDWTAKTLTYNGSMVCMFSSLVATGLWVNIGDPPGIYNPPLRNWGWDVNYQFANKLPPATPALTVLVRSRWRMPAAFTTNVVAGF